MAPEPPGQWFIIHNMESGRQEESLYDAFSNRSATQTLMMDCRGTPRRRASLSSLWIIHKGKSTFTLFCSCPGLRAFEISRYLETSSPLSNFLSSAFDLIFIYSDLLF